MKHLLVTNDFPPKIGGIQNYLWELWRRLPPDDVAIYTTPYHGAAAFDAAHGLRIERSPEPVIGPYPWLVPRLNRYAAKENVGLVLLDPAVPLGAVGPWLERPYGVILHGAEVTVPGRLPGSRSVLANTLRRARLVVSAGDYALAEAERCAGRALPSVVVPPGVDHERIRPYASDERAEARERFGIGADDFVVATVNRLVPRKGMDTLIRAATLLAERRSDRPVRVLIGGTGRHGPTLSRLITELDAPARLLGRIPDEDVGLLYGAADAMAMLCHDRWRGLEQEGFGIVFLEAAAAGLPQVAGRSGGAHEAVVHGETGLIVDHARRPEAVADALEALMDDPALAARLGAAARARVVAEFDYDRLAARLGAAIDDTIDGGARAGTGDGFG
ncbi:MAG: glycosyltransferase family 4 protein [Actinomycetota bacterium]